MPNPDKIPLLDGDAKSQEPSAPPAYHAATTMYRSVRNLYADVPRELQADVRGARHGLGAFGLQGHKARVAVILDISSSMENPNRFYSTTKVTRLVNKALSMAYHFDDDKSVELFTLGAHSEGPFDVSLDNYATAVNDIVEQVGGLQNRTNYGAAIELMRKHYFANGSDKMFTTERAELPVFCLFVTDGEPNVQRDKAIAQFVASSRQPIFIKALALRGQQRDQQFTFLQDRDDAKTSQSDDPAREPNRPYLDNFDLQIVNDPSDLTFDMMLEEYGGWLKEAYTERNLLTQQPYEDASKLKINSDNRKVNNDEDTCCRPCVVM